MNKLKLSILLNALLVPLGAAFGQSQVSEIPSMVSDTTIVRYWQDDVSVVYTCNNSTADKYFMLVDKTTTIVHRIIVPPEVTVNDFRIYNNMVYVGGHHVDGTGFQRGLLACFDINDFYNGSGDYHLMVANHSPMPDCYCGGCKNQIYDITRIALYTIPYEGVQVAFIGKNYIIGESTMRVGIGHANYYMGFWNLNLIYNKYAEEEYTDIITTQNYVVAVARHNFNAHLVLRVFPQINFILHNWAYSYNCGLQWGFYPNKNGQEFADLKVDENVMATALDGDEFALAYHYIDSPKEGLAVKTFSIAGSIATLQQALNVPVTKRTKWKMRDLCYSSTKQQLLVLNDFDGGTLSGQESVIYQFPPSALVTGTYKGRYLPSKTLHALNIYGPTAEALVATGNPSGGGQPFVYWEDIVAPQSCGNWDEVEGYNTTATWDSIFMETNINDSIFKGMDSPFIIEDEPLELICNR